MLAGGGAQGEQPLLGLLQHPRVGLAVVGQPGQQGFRLGERFLGAVQRGQGRGGRVRLRRGQALQRPGGGAQGGGRAGVAAVPRRDFRHCRGDRLGPALALLQALAFGGQAVLLALLRRQLAQFVGGVAQPVLLPRGFGDCGAGVFQRVAGVAPGAQAAAVAARSVPCWP